jgi:hypothetical protein
MDAELSDVGLPSLDWGDYDGDGDLDLVVAGNNEAGEKVTRIYRNEGSGKFTAIGADLPRVSAASVAWGDYDGDGHLDLALAGSDEPFNYIARVYRNDGTGNFTALDAGLDGVGVTPAVDWGDYDGDGDLDLVVAGDDGFDNITTIYRNEGGGVLRPSGRI